MNEVQNELNPIKFSHELLKLINDNLIISDSHCCWKPKFSLFNPHMKIDITDKPLSFLQNILSDRIQRLFAGFALDASVDSIHMVVVGQLGKFTPIFEKAILSRLPINMHEQNKILDQLYSELYQIVQSGPINCGRGNLTYSGSYLILIIPD